MNILFTWPIHINPQLGGVERVTDLLAREFCQRGYKIFFLHTSHFGEKPEYDYEVQVSYLDSKDIMSKETHDEYKQYLKDNDIDVVIDQAGALGVAFLFGDVIPGKQLCLHVIHCNPKFYYDYFFTVISRLRSKRVIEKVKRLVRVILSPILKHRYFTNFKRHYLKMLDSPSPEVVLLSNRFKKSIKEILPDYPEQYISAIGNPSSFEIEKCEKENILLFVGRFDVTYKRPDRVIKIWEKIFSKYPDWRLVMVGDGPERSNVEKQAEAANLPRIEFVGFAPPQDYYKRAKIILMTSNIEGLPMVLLEAMCFGCVPMAFESFDAIRDLIRSDVQLVKPFSINEYSHKLEKIMSDSSLYTYLQSQGYDIAREFEIGKIVDMWEVLIKRKYSEVITR